MADSFTLTRPATPVDLSHEGEVKLTASGRPKTYNPRVKGARRLRRDMTDAEKKLWALFGSQAVAPFKFRRQHPIGMYVADFACVEVLLVVEIDGGQHADNPDDAVRTEWLKQRGWSVIRFWNNEVLENPDGVLEVLNQYLQNSALHRTRKTPLPHGRGRGPLRQQWEGEGEVPDGETSPSPAAPLLSQSHVDLSHEGEVKEGMSR